MKFTIGNLLFAMLAFSLAVGWYVDRSSLTQKYDRDILAIQAVDRVQVNTGLWASFYATDLSIDDELIEILKQRADVAERFLNLMSIYQSRNSLSDPSLAKTFTQVSMQQLGCKDIADLRELIEKAKWDYRIVVSDESEESAQFEEFLKQAMTPLN